MYRRRSARRRGAASRRCPHCFSPDHHPKHCPGIAKGDGRVIRPSRDQRITDITPYVVEMHQKSGLWLESLSSRIDLQYAETEAADFIRSHTDKAPACGSSVHFDRRFLKAQAPVIDEAFHYRNIDVSTLKNLCAIYCPEANETAPPPVGKHRAIDDIADSIALLKHYLNYVKWPGTDFLR